MKEIKGTENTEGEDMNESDIRKADGHKHIFKKAGLRTSAIYLGGSLFTLVFGRIYTHFGYGVTSRNMDLAFVWLLLGTVLYAVLAFAPKRAYPPFASSVLVAYSLVCMTLYSVINGILDIAGAFSNAAVSLPVSAVIMLAAAVIFYAVTIIKKKG